MNTLPISILVALFAASAIVVWMAGGVLSRTTDVLARRFGLGEALGGLLLLAVATNLPEVAIILSAAARGEMSIAIGNVLGGIAIQTVVLVLIDRFGTQGAAPLSTQAASPALLIEALLVMVILIVVVLGDQLASLGRLGPFTLGDALVPCVWIAGVWIVVSLRGGEPRGPPANAPNPVAPSKTRGATLAFLAAAGATLLGGMGLEATGHALANDFGINGVVFGATVLAAATSLPEISTGLASSRAGQVELAVSDIFGGNAVLPLLLTLVALVSGQSAFGSIDQSSLYLCGLGAVLTAFYAAEMIVRPRRRILGMGPASLLVSICYVLGLAGLVAVGAPSQG